MLVGVGLCFACQVGFGMVWKVYTFLSYNPILFTQSALGYDYQANLSKHQSQVDAAKGFGGKYGVQTDRRDKVRGSRRKEGKERG